jgi:hypothetical protein
MTKRLPGGGLFIFQIKQSMRAMNIAGDDGFGLWVEQLDVRIRFVSRTQA